MSDNDLEWHLIAVHSVSSSLDFTVVILLFFGISVNLRK